MENHEIARVFADMAAIAEIRGDNAFKVRALRGAAETIAGLPHELAAIAEDSQALRSLKGIGEGIAKRITELVTTGKLREFEEMLTEYPPSLLELLGIEGVGPKKVALFHDELGVRDIDGLEKAARAGQVRTLPRMSAATEAKLLKAIEAYRARGGRFLLAEGEHAAARLVQQLAEVDKVHRIEVAGSVRRRRETVKDLDILVACDDPRAVMNRFVQDGDVIGRGETKCSIKLASGMNADLRVVPLDSFGAALHYFTGSKAHNVAIRTLAARDGFTINEYGVFRLTKKGEAGERVGGEKEEDVFRTLGLAWIPPELREDRGEIEAARKKRGLPALVELNDVRGDVHMHTTATDGTATIEEMARAARARGYGYIAITDHSQALAMARGLDEKRLRAHAKAIRKVDAELGGEIRVFTGIEVDILKNGDLDLPTDALRELDVVIASVHSHFGLAREAMTARIVRAIESGVVDLIGHPTGRLLTRRDPYALDMERVMEAALAHGVALEVSAFPERLDLSDTHCRMARDLGVPVVINTDAHAPDHLDLMTYGVSTARRGWLRAADVLNTREADEFLARLHAGHRE